MGKFNIKNRRYLGSKAKLLSFITEVVNKECRNINIFLDLFGGTGNVAWNFNNQYTTIMVNDILMSNYLSYIAWFGSQEIDECKISSLIARYKPIALKIKINNLFNTLLQYPMSITNVQAPPFQYLPSCFSIYLFPLFYNMYF